MNNNLMQEHRIAVLITCHNRKTQTLQCLKSLFKQNLPQGWQITVFLVDDGSLDGTGDAVASEFPEVNLIPGSGNLFWNRGTRLAWDHAEKQDFEFFLWLNDDVELVENAILKLIETHEYVEGKGFPPSNIVGNCISHVTGLFTYGGLDASHKIVFDRNEIRECETMNGNIVLVPEEVYNRVGKNDKKFTHSYGDYDFGKRTKLHGCRNYVVPGALGYCEEHGEGKWSDPQLSLSSRIRNFHSPKGLFPKDFFRYQWRHQPSKLKAMLLLLNAYRRMLFGIRRKRKQMIQR